MNWIRSEYSFLCFRGGVLSKLKHYKPFLSYQADNNVMKSMIEIKYEMCEENRLRIKVNTTWEQIFIFYFSPKFFSN